MIWQFSARRAFLCHCRVSYGASGSPRILPTGSLPVRHYETARGFEDELSQQSDEDVHGSQDEAGASQASPLTHFEPTEEDQKRFVNRGVTVGKDGHLKIVSERDAKMPHQSALILYGASTSLSESDFKRLLDDSQSTAESGFEAAVPGRDPKTLDRLPYWVVLFKSPYHAALYQHRMRWYHDNQSVNLPMNPLEAALKPWKSLTPPPGYVDPHSGEDLWKRLHEYALLPREQSFKVLGFQSPFSSQIGTAIKFLEKWQQAAGQERFLVRLRLYHQQWNVAQVARFIKRDGEIRVRPWELARGDPDDVSKQGSPQNMDDAPVYHAALGLSPSAKSQNFLLAFCNEAETMRFWGTWHARSPPPELCEEALGERQEDVSFHVEIVR